MRQQLFSVTIVCLVSALMGTGCGGSDGEPANQPVNSDTSWPLANNLALCSCNRSDLNICEDFLISSSTSVTKLVALQDLCGISALPFVFLSGCPEKYGDPMQKWLQPFLG